MTDPELVQALAGVPEGPRARFLDFHAQHPIRRLAVGARSLEYVSFGRGKRVLVHLPGLLSDARAAVHLASLGDEFRILSPTYLDTDDVGAQIDAIARMLEAERVDRAALVGQTLGGYVAQLFASAHPSSVSHLVLAHAGVPEPGQMPSLETTHRFVRLIPFPVAGAVLTRLLLGGVAKAGRHPDVDPGAASLILAYFRFRQSRMSRQTALARYGLSRELGRAFPRYRDGLMRWRGKALVFYGRGAWCNERHVARLRELYASVEAHRFEAGGHWNIYLQPDESARVIERFIGADASA
jgi:pimeloyl-ACP methyl ester carboxylesterase